MMSSSIAAPLLINLSFLLDQPTGTSTYAYNLLPYLDPTQSLLLSPRSIAGHRHYPLPTNQTAAHGAKGHLRRLLWTQFQLPRLYQSLQARLLFCPIPEAPLSDRCRSVVMVHDCIPLRFPEKWTMTLFFRHYVPQVLHRAQHILCNSQATAQDLTRFYGIPSQKITPIWEAYDVQHFYPRHLPTRNYFLYVGRHNPYKNVGRSIAAFAQVARQQDCEFWIAGPYDRRYSPQLQAQIAELRLTDRVKFTDYVPYEQLPALYEQAIALVFPSLWEGFGLPVLEAMACGTPVITSNCAALPEVAGDAAILVHPESVSEIAAAMQAILQESGVRSQLQQRGWQRVQQFSWAETGKATMAVLAQYL